MFFKHFQIRESRRLTRFYFVIEKYILNRFSEIRNLFWAHGTLKMLFTGLNVQIHLEMLNCLKENV